MRKTKQAPIRPATLLAWLAFCGLTLPGHATSGHAVHAVTETTRVAISAESSGWTHVDRDALVAAGLDPDVDPRFLRLTTAGVEQAIVVRGGDDERFDPGDAIEFYARGLDTPWDGARTYWLSVAAEPGRRVVSIERPRSAMAPTRLAGATEAAATTFPHTAELREKLYFSAGVKNGEAENWFGELLLDVPLDQSITVPSPDLASTLEATLEVELQGWTTRDHDVRIDLNGTEVGSLAFTGRTLATGRVPIPAASLLDGINLVTLHNRTELAESFVSALRVTYPRRYEAEANRLRFTIPAGHSGRIEGFTDPAIRLFDITDPASPREQEVDLIDEGGHYAIDFADAPSDRRLLAVSESAIQSPASVRERPVTEWTRVSHQADVLMIAPGSFLEALEPLRDAREAQGLTVARIAVEDLYDELGHGEKSPHAIRDFITHTLAAWAEPKPRFLLLAGDATWDPRDYRGLGDYDLVPGRQVVTGAIETISDDWLADLDHDGVPELAVGRLPVRTVDELDTVVGKILRYEATPAGRPWTSEVLMAADEPSGGYDFADVSTSLETSLPAALRVTRIHIGNGSTTARADLLEHFERGNLLVNFNGHGSRTTWGRDGLFGIDDVDHLGNADRLPFVVAMNCANGLFHSLYSPSLAEGLLTAEGGGAIAVWASSGFTARAAQARMNRELLRVLFTDTDDPPTLGEAVVAAKAAVANPDLRRTWILFGDPATRLLPVVDPQIHAIFVDGFESGSLSAWSPPSASVTPIEPSSEEGPNR